MQLRFLIILALFGLALPAPAAAAARSGAHGVGGGGAPAPPAGPAAIAIPAHPQFLRDVAPILDKQGCSTAQCHGKFGGRGDFQLSLLTLSPDDDYYPIVHGARGRRVNLEEPEKSLVLLKPTMQVPHGGGLRFAKTSPEYRTLLNWLKDGAPLAADDARVESLTIQPQQLVLPVGGKVQLKVTAKWWDGRAEDVTRKAVYASADEPVARVSSTGLVDGLRWGGTSIQIRFLGMARAVFLTLPQARKDNKPFPDVPRANLIDRYVFDNLKRMNVLPSGLTTDEQFCRRVYLDVIGVLPTPEELERFLGDKAPDRRAKLIDQLLERPEFVDLRTLRLADMLRLNPRKISGEAGFGERAVILFTEWIRDNVAKNRPYNEFVHDLLAARGKIYFNGPADFWAIERAPNDRAETTGQAFLGVRMQCARCHKHPFDRWSTDDYWNFSAFFGKVQLRGVPDGVFGDQEVFYDPNAQTINQSVTGKQKGLPAKPSFLAEAPIPPEQQQNQDLSLLLAQWVTSPQNRFFARASVNRLWSQFFGRGIVHPVDDMRETTPESVPGLLGALAGDFVAHRYDVKYLIRQILNSRTYQLSAAPNDSNALDDRFYAHYYPKPMLAQVLLDAINQATGVSERLSAFPVTRSVELPVPADNYFLSVFGQSHREYLTELDPKLEPNLVQTLHMMNSPYINDKLRAGSTTRELAQAKLPDDQLVARAFMRTLCRRPSAEETAAALKILPKCKSREEWVQDLMWALVASREFLFIG